MKVYLLIDPSDNKVKIVYQDKAIAQRMAKYDGRNWKVQVMEIYP